MDKLDATDAMRNSYSCSDLQQSLTCSHTTKQNKISDIKVNWDCKQTLLEREGKSDSHETLF